jgi:hypothetical protein
MAKKTKKKKTRNAFTIQAKQRKAGKIKARNKKRLNGKNKQQELMKENAE